MTAAATKPEAQTEPFDVPDGVHDDLTSEQYDAIPAMRRTVAKHGLVSMRRLKAAIDGKIQCSSDALRFGAAFHALLLEPDIFKSRYRVTHGCPAKKKGGDECGNPAKRLSASDGMHYCGVHLKKTADDPYAVTHDEHVAMRTMRDAVYEHDAVQALRRKGGFEATVVGELCGVRCKAKLDKVLGLDKKYPVIADIKKTTDVSEDALERTIDRYRLDLQAAWYCDLLESITGKQPQFVFIFCLDCDDYDVAARPLDAESLQVGRDAYRSVLHQYKQSLESGKWPGVNESLEPIGLPAWRLKQHQRFHLN